MDFKFPFPTLQDIASLAVAHSFIKSKVDPSFFRRCEKKVNKMSHLPEKVKSRVLEALKGTFDYVSTWIFINQRMFAIERPNLIFDVYGSIDECRTIQCYLDRSHGDRCNDKDLKSLEYLLRMACFYTLQSHIPIILERILALHYKDTAVPQLVEPEFEEADEGLRLKYRFANGKELGISYSGDDWKYSKTEGLSTGFDVTLKLCCYKLRFLRSLDWDALSAKEPIMSIDPRCFQVVVGIMHLFGHYDRVVQIIDVLGPKGAKYYLASRENGLTLLKCLLVWPFQAFFLGAFEVLKSLLHEADHFHVFVIIVNKQEMKAFEDILFPFWNAVPSSAKTWFHEFACKNLRRMVNKALKKLSYNNALMYEKIVRDLQLPDDANRAQILHHSRTNLNCCTIM